jgi:hypothetical protein
MHFLAPLWAKQGNQTAPKFLNWTDPFFFGVASQLARFKTKEQLRTPCRDLFLDLRPS